jgi:hypothetical protein
MNMLVPNIQTPAKKGPLTLKKMRRLIPAYENGGFS